MLPPYSLAQVADLLPEDTSVAWGLLYELKDRDAAKLVCVEHGLSHKLLYRSNAKGKRRSEPKAGATEGGALWLETEPASCAGHGVRSCSPLFDLGLCSVEPLTPCGLC